MRLLVHGLGVAGEAVARAAVARGHDVITSDDRPTPAGRALARELGLDLLEAPAGLQLAALVRSVDIVVPSPGVPEHHPLIVESLAAGSVLRTELDLAYEWERERTGGARPVLAITGTDGKTTVTTLVTSIVEASGRRAVACGNTEIPLVSALDLDVEVFVVESASFRLRWLTMFRPDVGTWLNLADDHLDWHGGVEAYAAAKARLWDYQRDCDVAVANADDPAVMSWAASTRARLVTFGSDGDYREHGNALIGPHGELIPIELLWRRLPHDRSNALAAAATALESGCGTEDGLRAAIGAFRGIAHRISLVGEHGGVSYYDDSKATTPHAVIAAIRGFDHVVLIAGGRNKQLDLRALASEPSRVRAVVAIGEAASEIRAAFVGVAEVISADSMDEAVAVATDLAEPGDAVLLSPGCTSFDWYTGYAERGEDFARAVRVQLAAGGGR